MYEEWCDKIPSVPKLRYYVKFKQDVNTAPYLKRHLTQFQQSLLAQLRLGILPLTIETGRYVKIPFEERCCTFCTENLLYSFS